jgi:hypothetical protein
MESIRWQFYPYVAENPHGQSWLETQAMLGDDAKRDPGKASVCRHTRDAHTLASP